MVQSKALEKRANFTNCNLLACFLFISSTSMFCVVVFSMSHSCFLLPSGPPGGRDPKKRSAVLE